MVTRYCVARVSLKLHCNIIKIKGRMLVKWKVEAVKEFLSLMMWRLFQSFISHLIHQLARVLWYCQSSLKKAVECTWFPAACEKAFQELRSVHRPCGVLLSTSRPSGKLLARWGPWHCSWGESHHPLMTSSLETGMNLLMHSAGFHCRRMHHWFQRRTLCVSSYWY